MGGLEKEVVYYVVNEISIAYNRYGFSGLQRQRSEIEAVVARGINERFANNNFNLDILPKIINLVLNYLQEKNLRASSRMFSITDFDRQQIFDFIYNFPELI